MAPHVIEKLLNHTMQGVMAIYNRADYEAERIEATERWAREIERVVSQDGARHDNVVPLKRKRK